MYLGNVNRIHKEYHFNQVFLENNSPMKRINGNNENTLPNEIGIIDIYLHPLTAEFHNPFAFMIPK